MSNQESGSSSVIFVRFHVLVMLHIVSQSQENYVEMKARRNLPSHRIEKHTFIVLSQSRLICPNLKSHLLKRDMYDVDICQNRMLFC